MDLRRKTRYVQTNVLLNEEDTNYYNKWCPIDGSYTASSDQCSGSYRMGGFSYYPPFWFEGCQC